MVMVDSDIVHVVQVVNTVNECFTDRKKYASYDIVHSKNKQQFYHKPAHYTVRLDCMCMQGI